MMPHTLISDIADDAMLPACCCERFRRCAAFDAFGLHYCFRFSTLAMVIDIIDYRCLRHYDIATLRLFADFRRCMLDCH